MRNPVLLVLLLALTVGTFPGSAQPAPSILGDAPAAPTDVSSLPGRGPRPRVTTSGLTVSTSSREQVREFYNAVYTPSIGVPINSTAQTALCVPGTNSPAFANATLLRVNWYRALAGLPAAITFDATESTQEQAAAVMMSEHGALQHVGIWTNWDCFTVAATNASAHSNLGLGNDGPDAIDAYMVDDGANNYEVGHRRWVLYPQTQIMGTGDVPAQGTNLSANALWVFDANLGGPRPTTRTPYVCWPPAGYVPHQVVFPQWSFALSNADLSAAQVTMASNGVAVPVSLQSYATGFGENSLVWYPTSLNPNTGLTFPFGGTDTVYALTISNVMTTAGTAGFAYTVTLFDPGTLGADYVPLVISGTNHPSAWKSTPYTCTPSANPNTTSYQWLVAQPTNGNLVDNALNGLTNFTISPTPIYPVITNSPTDSAWCFHLCHTNPAPLWPAPQWLQLNRVLFPSNSATLSFYSLLGYATTNEVARVQVSTDVGANWQDIYTQTGILNSAESSFTPHSFPLTNYIGQRLWVRFNYDLSYGSYYDGNPDYIGWCLENISIANCQQLVNQTTNATSSTNFVFTPAQAGNYLLQARAVILNNYTTDLGTAKAVTVVTNGSVILLAGPQLAGGQVKIPFTLAGPASAFHLLQASQLSGPWTTNASATLVTNVPGSSFQFTTTNSGAALRFYRVNAP